MLLTAFSQRNLIESARDAGVVAYLVKPFRSSEILPKLAAILNPAVDEPKAVNEVRHIDDKIETREIVQRAMRGRTRMRDVAQQILKGEFVG